MENLIKDAILLLQDKKKRPSMQNIYNVIKRADANINMEDFKNTFDDCLERQVVKKRTNRDSYFVAWGEEIMENEENEIPEVYAEDNILNEFSDYDNFSQDSFIQDDIQFKDRDLFNRHWDTIYDEKVRVHDIIDVLKENIRFLKDQVLSKDRLIFNLLAMVNNKTLVETVPSCSTCVNKTLSENVITNETDGNLKSVDNSTQKHHKKQNKEKQSNYTNHNDDRSNYSPVTNKVEIIGDSLLNGIINDKLSRNNTITSNPHPGCTTNDMKHFVNESIKNKPEIIICHSGTNDITNNVDTIANYQSIINKIKRNSSHTKIAISSVIKRFDRRNIEKMVVELNEKLKTLCEENIIDFIDNDNIDESCLGQKKLHLGQKGNAYLASNFIRYVKSVKSKLSS